MVWNCIVIIKLSSLQLSYVHVHLSKWNYIISNGFRGAMTTLFHIVFTTFQRIKLPWILLFENQSIWGVRWMIIYSYVHVYWMLIVCKIYLIMYKYIVIICGLKPISSTILLNPRSLQNRLCNLKVLIQLKYMAYSKNI